MRIRTFEMSAILNFKTANTMKYIYVDTANIF